MVMSQKTLFNKTALAVAVAIVSTSAWSAGFQLNEFSSSGLGRAYSGEGAIADDAGNASRNPALIMMFDRPTFSAGAVYIDPDVNISGKSPYTGASLKADNIAPTAWVPNLHFVAPINDQFGWGHPSPLTTALQPSSITTIRQVNTAVKPTLRR
jgi:long-chain fatty acid transport protein